MNIRILVCLFCMILISQTTFGQTVSKKIDGFTVTSSKAILLGKTKSVRESAPMPGTSKIKKKSSKLAKKVPDNFKGRRDQGKAVDHKKEHQGVDLVLQSEVQKQMGKEIEILANIEGRGNSSPTDPTGDVDSRYYVQAVNATLVGVYNLDGSVEATFSMNQLWSDFGVQSLGDPIILYDEIEDRWILTEFTGPSNLLIAVSETNDPLGTYATYSYTTPNFPDYPKYAITEDYVVVTTNEEGPSDLHQYFIDKKALIAGEPDADFQRVEIDGSNGTEQGFYVMTPADLNGTRAPFDSRPIALRLNDSSWAGGPAEDQIEMYKFDIDFDNASNTTIEQTSIVVSPYDSHPCSTPGPNFSCIPQLGGAGLDGIPEVIMNVPHQRNFGTHESLVLTFVTDITDGDNVAGVRWIELRRTADSDWDLYQEGTYAPDDGLQRFMSSVAIDDKGNICLAYNVSSADSYAGIRATGRNSSDPLGMMTYDELVIREGEGPTSGQNGRFGDYSQMSVAPGGKSEFWFTIEYGGTSGTRSNITGMSLTRDTFDLSLSRFLTPNTNSSALTAAETVTVEVTNSGLNPMADYTVALLLDGNQIDLLTIPDTLQSEEKREHTFSSTVDFTNIRDYNFTAIVNSPIDQNLLNDTLRTVVTKLPNFEAALTGSFDFAGCEQELNGNIRMTNFGGEIITDAVIALTVNGVAQADIIFEGSISFEQARDFPITLTEDLVVGDNDVKFEIVSINTETNDFNPDNNILDFEVEILDESQFVIIRLTTDDFPLETSYTLTSQNSGNIITEENSFTDQNTLHDNKVCVAEGDCFSLTLLDSYADGICCTFGEGSIEVLDNVGNVLVANDGQFGAEITIEFCNTPGECQLDAEIELTDNTAVGPGNGAILITPMGGVGPYEFSIDGGTTLQNSNVFTDLESGDYTVYLIDLGTDCEYEETAEIETGLSDTYIVGDAIVSVDIVPNPTDGVFKINVTNLPISDPYLDIEIYDIQGKLLQNRKIGKYDEAFVGTFSLYAYPAGTYLIRVKAGENNFLERIVKQ